MARPYDFDAQVQRALERERTRAAVEVARTPGQMQLFEMEPTVVRPPWRYESLAGLVVDDELLFSRAISLHSAQKAYLARMYASIVGVAMARKWELWWVELFAGPGRLYVRETGDFIAGSPIEALTVKRPFNGYVFADLNRDCVESLRRRIGPRPNVHVLHGNANGVEMLDEIARIVPRTALVVLYGDQAGLDLGWPTLKFFIDRYRRLDLLLNLPTEGVVRAISAGYERKASTLLDHPAPHELLATSGPKGDLVRDWFRRRLSAEGFDQLEGVTIKLRGRNRDLYDLLLASRNPLAPKFFHEAIASFERHQQAAAS